MENAHYFLHVTDTHLCFDAETPDTCCTEKSLRSLYQTAFAWDHRPAFAKAIAGIGYDDYITLEMLPNYKQFPEVSLYADKYAMNKIIEMIHL